jgi:hypothetical protein
MAIGMFTQIHSLTAKVLARLSDIQQRALNKLKRKFKNLTTKTTIPAVVTSKIPTPTNLRKTIGSTKFMVKLAWNASAFDSFEVVRPASGAGPEVLLGVVSVLPTDADPFVLPDGAPLGTYNVAVRAVKAGVKSALSNQVQITVAMEIPSNLHVVE